MIAPAAHRMLKRCQASAANALEYGEDAAKAFGRRDYVGQDNLNAAAAKADRRARIQYRAYLRLLGRPY